MTKKSLYDANDRWTSEGNNLDNEVFKALEPIFAKYVKMGYSPREAAHVAMGTCTQLELMSVLNIIPLQEVGASSDEPKVG